MDAQLFWCRDGFGRDIQQGSHPDLSDAAVLRSALNFEAWPGARHGFPLGNHVSDSSLAMVLMSADLGGLVQVGWLSFEIAYGVQATETLIVAVTSTTSNDSVRDLHPNVGEASRRFPRRIIETLTTVWKC